MSEFEKLVRSFKGKLVNDDRVGGINIPFFPNEEACIKFKNATNANGTPVQWMYADTKFVTIKIAGWWYLVS